MALLTKAAQRAARWGLSSAGRALHWQCRGQGFDSPRLHQYSENRRFAGSYCNITDFCRLTVTSVTARTVYVYLHPLVEGMAMFKVPGLMLPVAWR